MPGGMTALRIATWNINSLRLRLSLLERLIADLRPDVICLQETKVPDELFPEGAPATLGFPHVARRGMKGYNGVAILSRLPLRLDEASPDWCERGDCRHLAVTLDTPGGPVELHDFYVPAGGDVPDPAENPKFAHKLAFVQQVTDHFTARPPARSILVGDLNIAPLEHDVWSHKQLLGVVSHTPIETEALNALLSGGHGWVDVVRKYFPSEEKLYSWWSYRAKDWEAANKGRRLDHIWTTADIAAHTVGAEIIKPARGWSEKPSDHVPVIARFA